MIFLYILVALIALYIFVSALRNKVLREIGFRNIFRRKGTTALVILGSLIGTALISGSLTLNDSFNQSTKAQAEKTLGEIDIRISTSSISSQKAGLSVQSDPKDGLISTDYINKLTNSFDKNKVDGTLPALIYSTSLVKGKDATKDLSVTNVDIIAFPNTKFASEDINFNVEDGKTIVSKGIADRLELQVGDKITSFNGINNFELTVQAINSQDGASAYTRRNGNIIVSESFIRQEFKLPNNTYNYLFVSSKGGVYDSTYDSTQFTNYITSKTDAISLQDMQWSVNELKSSSISGGNDFILYLFLGVSIVGIIAGILLIINIYSMLAEERKSEMGTMRAIAFTRGKLIKTFVYEGFFYSVISSVIGVFIGVGIGFVLLSAVLNLTKSILENSNFKISFYTQPQSWALAFCIGMIITFGTSYLASRRISKINIVSAIRDIEDEKDIKVTKFGIFKLVFQILLLINSIGSIIAGIYILKNPAKSQLGDIVNPESLGAYLLFIGIVLACVLASLLINKLLIRLGKEKLRKYFVTALNLPPLVLSLFIAKIDLFNKVFESVIGYSLLLVTGLTIVITITMLITYNVDVLLWIIEKTIGRIARINGIVKLSLRYSGENKFRTGLTILMFSLVLFLVAFLSVARITFDQQIEQFIPKSGYEAFVGAPKTVNTDQVIASVNKTGVTDKIAVYKSMPLVYDKLTRTDFGTENFYTTGKPTDKESTSIFGIDQDFLQTNPLKLYSRMDIFKSDDEALNAAVTTGQYIFLAPQAFGSKIYTNPPDFLKLGHKLQFNVQGKVIELTIAGYLDFTSPQNYTIFQYGLITGYKSFDNISPTYISSFASNNIMFKIKNNGQTLANNLKEIQKTLIPYNLASGLFSIANIFDIASAFLKGSIAILQGFLSFALFVGIAGIAIIMVRSVNERRQQIGMLRALGFQRKSVLISFFLEASFIILIGIAIGIFSGVVTANIFFDVRSHTAQANGVDRTVIAVIPYKELLLIGLGTYVTSLIFTLLPSYQASRLTPVEATNYLD